MVANKRTRKGKDESEFLETYEIDGSQFWEDGDVVFEWNPLEEEEDE